MSVIPTPVPTCKWTLLTAGNANVVYKSDETDQLLRLRRQRNAPSTAEVDEYLTGTIRPAIGSFLFDYTVVNLPVGFLESLPEAEDLDLGEPLGLLMENLGPKPQETNVLKSHAVKINYSDDWKSYTVELKPKWLLRSPTEPKDSLNCRTCALQLKRGKPRICPLRLFNSDEKTSLQALEEVFPGTEKQLEPLAKFFSNSELFAEIRHMQNGDELGILGYSNYVQVPPQFVTAMTMRDVSLFVHVEGEQVTGKIVDADLKSASDKRDYWASLETDLIEGGWYEKTGTNCLLSNN
ncbi:Inositol-pentakisphosphate 2-kinase [Yarrowia sp. E02]|nr:Inositol-pentakisphosphate 2-kinase [Yarrowia sp. E02]